MERWRRGEKREERRGGSERGEEMVTGKRGRREGGEGGVNLPTIIEWSSLRKMLVGFMSLWGRQTTRNQFSV